MQAEEQMKTTEEDRKVLETERVELCNQLQLSKTEVSYHNVYHTQKDIFLCFHSQKPQQSWICLHNTVDLLMNRATIRNMNYMHIKLRLREQTQSFCLNTQRQTERPRAFHMTMINEKTKGTFVVPKAQGLM